MTIQTGLDVISCLTKPKKGAGIIKKRAAANWVNVNIAEFADLVGNKGYAFVPGHLIGGECSSNCKGIQLFVLDFDSGISFEEIARRCSSYDIPISFAYHTFSSSDECEKFRVVFTHNTLIEDVYAAKIILLMLHRVFPECDSSCKDLSRLFYGGKELIYINESAYIACVPLFTAFCDALDQGGNYARNIKRFCINQHIFMLNERPVMGDYDARSVFGDLDDFASPNIIHIIAEDAISSFFIVEDTSMIRGKQKNQQRHPSHICGPTMQKVSSLPGISGTKQSSCQLLNDFISGKELDHGKTFAILTNLKNIKGGESLFFNILSKYRSAEDVDRWKRNVNYMKGYHPQICSDTFCPYYNLCDNCGNMVNTLLSEKNIRILERENYCSIEDMREQLSENIDAAIRSDKPGLHLITAQTAAGKTYSYVRLIAQHEEKNFIVAVPTNNLKKEVYNQLIQVVSPSDVCMTKSIQDNDLIPQKVQDRISQNYSRGIYGQTKDIIEHQYKKETEKHPERVERIKEYEDILLGLNYIKGKRIIVTTHAYLKNLDRDFLKNYTIIIDEDILLLQFFQDIKCTSLKSVKKLSELNIDIYSETAEEILASDENVYGRLQPHFKCPPLTQEQLDATDSDFDDNLNDLVHAQTYVKLKDSETGEVTVYYFCPPRLPALKYIVLSATLNENLYTKYFEPTMEVHLYPKKKARYTGRLIQYPYHTLGRRDLGEKKQVFPYACRLADNDRLTFITFANFPGKTEMKKINFSDLHFGNSAGINKLCGKDIGIVGTYFQQEQAYKLVALYLGADVNSCIDSRPRRRRVTYKNKEFVIMSYSDALLREVQLYSIESEMEQCVGRARLLSQDCTVYLFSCFPCEQAELRNGNYLLHCPEYEKS